jgi:ABC-type transporter MlaC component
MGTSLCRIVPAAAGALLVALVSSGAAAEPTALDVVRTSNGQVLAIFAKHPVVDPPTEKELLAVIDAVTDYDGIAEAAVGPYCGQAPAERCTAFKETFKRLLRISSIKKLGRYRADRFDYLGEEPAEGAAGRRLVRTTAWFKDEKVPLDYLLAPRGGSWVIENYVVDEVDTIRNYHQQFAKLLAKGTVDSVIERLERKIKDYEAEK